MDSDAILTAVNAVESITNPPHTPERSSYRARKTVEQIIHLIFLLCGIVAVAFVLLISIYLILSGLPAIRQIGLFQFLLGKVWDPTNTTTGAQYGILPFILTSVYGTAGAIVIGVPVGLLTAVFLAKVAPPKLAAVIRTAVQLLAGIPSVVYGLVGMIVLVPAIRNLFHLSSGACLLAAMIVLAIMILPSIINVSETALRAVPKEYEEASLALGAAEMETYFRVSVRAARSGIAAAVVLLSILLSRMLTRKISTLLTAIRKVRAGAYEHRTHISGRDEIAQIGEEFNSLTDRLQTTETLRRRFVSDASHELKTPLAAIRLLTDSILQTDQMDMETVRDFVTDIGSEAERLSRITEDLLRLTRLDSDLLDAPETVEVAPVLEQVMRMMSLLAQEKGTELTYRMEENCRVSATKGEVHQVIYNLTDNAVKYSGKNGKVRVELRHEDHDVVLTVVDNGPGIPEEDLPKVFERFYRVDKARSRAAGGTGLGLSIVQDTVKKRGGTVSAANRSNGGAVFTVRWPEAEGGDRS